MAGKPSEVSYSQVVKKTSMAVVIGAFITPLFILVPGLLQVLKSGEEYYGLDYAGGFFIVVCGLQLAYQLPIYIASNLLFVRLFNYGQLKSLALGYFLSGLLGWVGNAGMLTIIDPEPNLETIFGMLEMGIPVLVIYYFMFLFPEMKMGIRKRV